MVIKTVENPDESITIIGSKYKIKIPAKTVKFNKRFFPNWTPAISKCDKCGANEYVLKSTKKISSELVMYNYMCLNCGYKCSEPLD